MKPEKRVAAGTAKPSEPATAARDSKKRSPGRGAKQGERRGGRQKGVPNKVTTEFRQTVARLLESNAANVERWLRQVAEGDEKLGLPPDPAKALDLVAKLAEFAAPKLTRSEHTGQGGGPIPVSMSVEFVKPGRAS